jgi:glycosyltransferase involved in cell wall biosynthesis
MLSAILVTLGDPATLTGGYLYHRRLAELGPRHGCVLEFVSFPQRPFPLAIVDAPRVLGQITKKQPDVVVLDSIAAAFMAFQAPARPMLAMLHQPPGGIDHGPLRTRVQAGLDRLAYRRARRLLVASESLAEDLRRQGQPAQRIVVVPPGRDVADTVGQPPGDLREGRRAAFLSVGNWVERKGTLSLLEAFATLDQTAATLHLVGNTRVEPSYGDRVRQRLARSDLHGRVVVHGPLSTSQVAALYTAADVFVLPSLREPYGTVYGEAMAAGLPVVGWDAGNLPHLARDGVEGRVIAPGDHAALTAALAALAENEPLRRRLAAAARRRAATFPTWQETARRLFAELRVVVREAAA